MENTSILIYLLKSTLAFTALYGLYLLLFRKNQQFTISRFYLVFTIVFASLFPFIKFITYKTVEIPAFETAIPEITSVGQGIQPAISIWNSDNINNVTFYLYLIVSSIILIRLLYMLIRFTLKISKHSRFETLNGKKIIVSDNWNQTFSFFGIIVLPEKDFILKENQLLVMHELVHVKQYHSLDLLLAELFQVIHWFNPLAYHIKKDMREVHEFLADFNVVKGGASKHAYQQLLLNYLTNSVTPRVANSFSAKLLKKRFAMMTTNKTPKSLLFKYLLAIPVIAMLVGLMSFQTEVRYIKKNQPTANLQLQKQDTSKTTIQPFGVVEEMPKFNNKDTYVSRDYFSKQIQYPKEAKEKGIQGTVYVSFVVESNGKVSNVKVVKSVDPLLDKEAVRVIESMPDWTPGKQNGKNVPVQLVQSIYFYLNEKQQIAETQQVALTKDKDGKYEPFVVVEEMPKFDNRDIDAAKEYIAKNIKYPEIAAKNGIQGKVFVAFIVEEDGAVTSVKIERGVDPAIDKEAVRVIESMPKWTPGYQQGKAVRVKFILPVVFKLDEKK